MLKYCQLLHCDVKKSTINTEDKPYEGIKPAESSRQMLRTYAAETSCSGQGDREK